MGVAVNRTLAALRRAFSWAVSKDLLPINPALNMATDIQQENGKDRALSIGEISGFWKGLDTAAMGERSRLALKLVLATGQRPGEVCGARRSEIDLKNAEWLIPAKRAKNRKPHFVPLSPIAVELFQSAMQLGGEGEFVFPSLPRSRTAVAKPKPLQAHALSHAMRTELRTLGLDQAPAAPCCRHRSAAAR